jgi:hypothetical protein
MEADATASAFSFRDHATTTAKSRPVPVAAEGWGKDAFTVDTLRLERVLTRRASRSDLSRKQER